jgi:hypothetical protein
MALLLTLKMDVTRSIDVLRRGGKGAKHFGGKSTAVLRAV